ncbi:hypothetical protein [Methylosinus sp. Sm6]|uniref:hypothetical protein n=1 Tax=Methylosinus sp. Sm6 TaxID=2866948 RepID=UPI001C99BB99|nr:hypothetical protein [Methylosinus sp. Sm6]MBY6244188.1 hypothetical protein [Methylosinus sp. Sm6]
MINIRDGGSAKEEESTFCIGDRVRFTGDDMRDEGDACREIVGLIENIRGDYAALRDDAGNLWSVAILWLELIERRSQIESMWHMSEYERRMAATKPRAMR